MVRLALVTMLVLALGQGVAAAQAGDAVAGRTLWEGPATQCRNCHGAKGEGAFGPDLAGRHLTTAQFSRALRQPWGIMPAYIESQISEQDVANLVAYFDSLPAAAQPGNWRFDVPANAPRGLQALLAGAGCSQCHGPAFANPRADMGGLDADFEWFKDVVYNHTTAMPQVWKTLDQQPAVRVRMGNYSRTRLPEATLLDIFNYAKNDLGFRVPVEGALTAGVPGAGGVTYTLNVENGGLRGKGLTAEDLTVLLVVPSAATVVGTTGAGYQGVRMDPQLKANVAVWQLSKLAPKDEQQYTITLSQAGTQQDNIRGQIRWTRPVKSGSDQANIAPAPLQRATQ